MSVYLAIITIMCIGEFGIVYKGYITRSILYLGQREKDIVAIKTLKGID